MADFDESLDTAGSKASLPYGFRGGTDAFEGAVLSVRPRTEWLSEEDIAGSVQQLVNLCAADVDDIRSQRMIVDPAYAQARPITRAIDEIRWFLSAVDARLEAAGLNTVRRITPTGAYVLCQTQRDLLADLNNPLFKRLTSLWKDLEIGIAERLAEPLPEGVTEKSLRGSIRKDVQGELAHFLCQAPFCLWAMKQLGGHAGDTTIVRMILGETTTARTLLGNALDRWHLGTPVAQAHRNRVEDLATWLGLMLHSPEFTGERGFSGAIRVLNLGCGPAREIPKWLNQNRTPDLERVAFTLQDISEKAFEAARAGIAAVGLDYGPAMSYQPQNALRLALRYLRPALPELHSDPFHRIYCAGLYDYLNDELMLGVDKALFHQLASGGEMVVTNVEASNPGRHAQEFSINWELFYRVRQAMIKSGFELGQAMGVDLKLRDDITRNEEYLAQTEVLRPSEFCVTTDQTGYNLFRWLRKA